MLLWSILLPPVTLFQIHFSLQIALRNLIYTVSEIPVLLCKCYRTSKESFLFSGTGYFRREECADGCSRAYSCKKCCGVCQFFTSSEKSPGGQQPHASYHSGVCASEKNWLAEPWKGKVWGWKAPERPNKWSSFLWTQTFCDSHSEAI